MSRRLGVFGGTFDPIHNAHVQIARAALASANLDEVLFVVSAQPPHKHGETVASPRERLAMVEAALAGEDGLAASDIELRRDGPSYTADTLDALRDEHTDAELFLIVGMDSLVDLPKWREPERILKSAKLLVAPRPGSAWEIPAGLEGRYELIPLDESDVSSTGVRDRLQQEQTVHHLVPPTVEAHIKREGIYDEHADRGPRG